MKKFPFFAASALAACAVCAADFSFEGQWLLNGVPQSLIDTVCAVRFYAAVDAASPVATAESVPLKTDADGNFVISASAPSSLPDTFWAGVAPDGCDEISPRFRVAPAPFALAAADAKLVESDTDMILSGTATIDRLEASGDAVVENLSLAPGGTLAASNLQPESMRLKGLSMVDGVRLGMFDTSSAPGSPDCDDLSADKSVSATVAVSRKLWPTPGLYAETSSASEKCTFDTDGILVIALKAMPKKCPAPTVSVSVGSVAILSDFAVGHDGGNDTVKRCLSVPYRAEEEVSVTVTATGKSGALNFFADASEYTGFIGAKIRLVKFGTK